MLPLLVFLALLAAAMGVGYMIGYDLGVIEGIERTRYEDLEEEPFCKDCETCDLDKNCPYDNEEIVS